MILHIFDGSSKSLEPSEIKDKIWYLKVFTEKEEVQIRISEDHGKLHLTVENQLVIEPCASNAINILSRRF